MVYNESELNYYKKNPSHITPELDNDLKLALIDYNVRNIQYMGSQSLELAEFAMKIDPAVFKYLDKTILTPNFLEKVISLYPIMIQHVYEPNDELIKLALTKDMNVLQHLRKISTNIYAWLLARNGLMLSHIQAGEQTEDLIRIAIHENINAYKYAHKKTKEFDLFIISKDSTRVDLISEYWDEIFEQLIEYNPRLITKFLDKPNLLTQDIKKKVITKDPSIYRMLKNPDLDLMKFTALIDVDMLEYMPYNTELIDYVLEYNGLALKYLIKKDLRRIKKAITNNVTALKYIEFPRKFLIDYAFGIDGIALQFIDEPTYKQCLNAVLRNGSAIEFVPDKFKTKEIQLAGLQRKGTAIIKFLGTPADEEVSLELLRIEPNFIFKLVNPTDVMYSTAFKTFGSLIMFFDNWNDKFSADIISIALNQDGTVFKFVKNKTKKLALLAIRNFPAALQWVTFQDREIIQTAIEINPKTIFFADKDILDTDLLNLALELDPDYFERTAGELTWEQWLKILENKEKK